MANMKAILVIAIFGFYFLAEIDGLSYEFTDTVHSNDRYGIQCLFDKLGSDGTSIQIVKTDLNTHEETVLTKNSELLVNDNYSLTLKKADRSIPYYQFVFESIKTSDSGVYECRKVDSGNYILVKEAVLIEVEPRPATDRSNRAAVLYVCKEQHCGLS